MIVGTGLCGCGAAPRPRVPVDLSGPRPAAATFLHALGEADAPAARLASIGTDQQKQWIDAMASLVKGLRDYDRAITRRFGVQATAAHVELRQALLAVTQDPLTHIDDWIVKEGPTEATLYPAAQGIRLAARPPMIVRKDKGLWKVDLAAMAQDPSHDPAMVRQYRDAGNALEQTAREIAAGRYKTVIEAQQAVEQRLGGQ